MAVTSPYDGLTPEAIKAEMLADLQVKGAVSYTHLTLPTT